MIARFFIQCVRLAEKNEGEGDSEFQGRVKSEDA